MTQSTNRCGRSSGYSLCSEDILQQQIRRTSAESHIITTDTHTPTTEDNSQNMWILLQCSRKIPLEFLLLSLEAHVNKIVTIWHPASGTPLLKILKASDTTQLGYKIILRSKLKEPQWETYVTTGAYSKLKYFLSLPLTPLFLSYRLSLPLTLLFLSYRLEDVEATRVSLDT